MSDEIKDEVTEDVEGHGPRVMIVGDAGEDDAEGHRQIKGVSDAGEDDTEGHRQIKGVSDADEDDAEGHRIILK